MMMRVTTKGQVTIPKPVRDRLGIRPGTKVEFELAEDGRVYLRRVGESNNGNAYAAHSTQTPSLGALAVGL